MIHYLTPDNLNDYRAFLRIKQLPGEIVFSPFAGIGSEGYVSLQLGRRFYGCELKDEYYRCATKNLSGVVKKQEAYAGSLFD